MFPLAGSIRFSVPWPNAYSEPPLPVSDSWSNDWRFEQPAPHIPPATRSGASRAGPTTPILTATARTASPTADAGDVGVPFDAGAWLWWEVATLAMAARRSGDGDHAQRGQRRGPAPAPEGKPAEGESAPRARRPVAAGP